MHKRLYTILLLLGALTLTTVPLTKMALAQTPDAVALVGGDSVPVAVFQQRVRLARWETGQQLAQIVAKYGPGALTDSTSPYAGEYKLLIDPKGIGQQVLDNLINFKLIAHEAALRGISVSSDEINAQIDATFGLSAPADGTPAPNPTETAGLQANRDNYLGEAGIAAKMTQTDVIASYGELALQAKLYAVLTQDVPTQAEQIKVAHILLSDSNKAIAVLNLIKNGANFADLAKTNSIDTTTNAQGGDLGWTPRGVYAPEFETAIWNARVGDIIGPIKTQFGYHVILIADRAVRPLSSADYARAKNAAYQAWLNDAHTKTEISIAVDWANDIPNEPTLAEMGLPAAK